MNEEPTKITMTSYDTTVSWEVDNSDITIADAIHGMVTCLIGITFSKETIIKGMKEWLEDNEEC